MSSESGDGDGDGDVYEDGNGDGNYGNDGDSDRDHGCLPRRVQWLYSRSNWIQILLPHGSKHE